MSGIVLYLMLVNVLAWTLFGWDKRMARLGQWRVSERVLLVVVLLGGTIGAFAGRKMFRHKTRKQPFVMLLWLCVGVQCVGLVAVGLYIKYL